jgi:spore coat polysaccharide biosynthesis protein SpsF (cytidylyltransferase family)
MNILAITQARTGSIRLPNKILKAVQGKALLEVHVERIQSSKRISKLIVATTTRPEDKAVVQLCKKLGVSFFRGSEHDVLDRFYQATKEIKPNYVVRLTSDCPLLDGELMDSIIDHTISKELDYCSNTMEQMYPDGQDIEVFKFSALEQAWNKATLSSEREHVTPYIYNNSSYKGGILFSSDSYNDLTESYNDVRLTVDEQEDFKAIDLVIAKLGLNKKWKDYADTYRKEKEIHALNRHIIRNEGYLKSLKKDTSEQ